MFRKLLPRPTSTLSPLLAPRPSVLPLPLLLLHTLVPPLLPSLPTPPVLSPLPVCAEITSVPPFPALCKLVIAQLLLIYTYFILYQIFYYFKIKMASYICLPSKNSKCAAIIKKINRENGNEYGAKIHRKIESCFVKLMCC